MQINWVHPIEITPQQSFSRLEAVLKLAAMPSVQKTVFSHGKIQMTVIFGHTQPSSWMASFSIPSKIHKLRAPKEVLAAVMLIFKHLYLNREDLHDETKRIAVLQTATQLE